MSFQTNNIERENGEVAYVHFNIERRDLRDVVDDVTERLEALDSVSTVKAIRRTKTNPVVKTGGNDRVYFKWDDGKARANLTMAPPEIKDSVVEYLTSEQADEDEGPFPWDREEMADEARERIRERQERAADAEERQRERDRDMDERERIRESGNHRDETQREPRGGTERRGRDDASVEGKHTKFVPPYGKNETSYHQPGSGDKPHLNCEDCVHYIEGGGCHMVQGEIEPEGYCEDLYADVGLYARMYDGEFEINLASWGEMFEDRFGSVSFEQIGDRVREAIRKKLQ